MTFHSARFSTLLDRLANADSGNLLLISPFVTRPGLAAPFRALAQGREVRLLTRLNMLDVLTGVIDAKALAEFVSQGGRIRFHDKSLHSKIWISSGVAVVGSANLTAGGLNSNIEGAIELDAIADSGRFKEIREWCETLWNELRGSEKTSDDLLRFAERAETHWLRPRLNYSEESEDLGQRADASATMPSRPATSTRQAWLLVGGTSEERMREDTSIGQAVLEAMWGFSRRPSARGGDLVFLSELAQRADGKPDHCIIGRAIVEREHDRNIDVLPHLLLDEFPINERGREIIPRWPYLLWLKDVQVVRGVARNAVWLKSLTCANGEPLILPRSLARQSRIRLTSERSMAINSALEQSFRTYGIDENPSPQLVWWNKYLSRMDRYITKDHILNVARSANTMLAAD